MSSFLLWPKRDFLVSSLAFSWLAVIVVLVMDHQQPVDAMPPPESFRSCGPQLSLRLARVCGSLYATPTSHRRVRRGVVSDCCRNKCTDEHVQRSYCSNQADETSAEESPEDLEDFRNLPDSPVYKFHFGSPQPGTIVDEDPVPEEVPTTSPATTAKKSKLVIGRLPQDYINSWTVQG